MYIKRAIVVVVTRNGKMWRNLIVISVFMCVCKCENNYSVDCKKPHHHYNEEYGLWYGTGILYYIGFLVLKVKIAVIIGGFITLIIFFGKLWALIKYSTYIFDKKNDDHHHHEKIYVHQSPDYGHHGWHPPPQSYHSGPPSFDHGPPIGHSLGQAYLDSPPEGQQEGRSIKETVWDSLIKAKKFVDTVDLTELTFDYMNLKNETCKRRFVCEAEYKAKQNKLLDLGLLFFGKDLKKYKTNHQVKSAGECADIYRDCLMPINN